METRNTKLGWLLYQTSPPCIPSINETKVFFECFNSLSSFLHITSLLSRVYYHTLYGLKFVSQSQSCQWQPLTVWPMSVTYNQQRQQTNFCTKTLWEPPIQIYESLISKLCFIPLLHLLAIVSTNIFNQPIHTNISKLHFLYQYTFFSPSQRYITNNCFVTVIANDQPSSVSKLTTTT